MEHILYLYIVLVNDFSSKLSANSLGIEAN